MFDVFEECIPGVKRDLPVIVIPMKCILVKYFLCSNLLNVSTIGYFKGDNTKDKTTV
jgi:hypothetical protein